MSIVGIGTDLVYVPRIRQVLQRHGDRFAQRVMVSDELDRWRKHGDPAGYMAKRWAVKEAVAKALGTGIGGELSFHDLCVERTASGAPALRVTGRGRVTADRLGVHQWHVSISDDSDYAMAFVVAEGS